MTPGRKSNPPTSGPGTIRSQPIHDAVADDALACGYRSLASVIAEQGQQWRDDHDGQPLVVLSDEDPMVAALGHLCDAIVHLAAALTRLQQAKREGSRRAAQHYEGVLLIAGHMAREVPLHSFRRATQQKGRAA